MDLNWWRVRLSWRHSRKHHAPPNAERYRYAVVGGMAGWFATDDLKLGPKPGQALRYLPPLRSVDNGW